MTDSELLKFAAKAAGMTGNLAWWNPLDDDGDALRLAVKLNLHVLRFDNMTTVRKIGTDFGCDERDDGDPSAATRLAIVRVADEIGRAMP